MPLQGETKGILSLLRGVLSIHLLAVIAQATLAGMFLSGSGTALSWHEMTARALAAICMLQIATTGLLRVRGGCPTWMLISAIAILLAEVLETYSGYRGILSYTSLWRWGSLGALCANCFGQSEDGAQQTRRYRKVDS